MEDDKVALLDTDVASLNIKVSDDKLHILLSCSANDAAAPRTMERIEQEFHSLGLQCGLNRDLVSNHLSACAESGVDIVDLVIISGKPPVPAVDEEVVWSRDYFSKSTYFDPKSNRIDYRRAETSAEVEQGEVLAVLKAGIPGREGIDVFGKPVPSTSPRKADLKCGKNVSFDEETRSYSATTMGRVKLNGRTLQVDYELKVNGDVGADTGNLQHSGDIYISGDVAPNYKLASTGDIYIGGVLNGSSVVCGGDLNVRGGINGSTDKIIKVKGDVNTKYVDNAFISSTGSVTVECEINKANISSDAHIKCLGKVIGGTMYALGGITVGEAGVSVGTRTSITAGVSPVMERALCELKCKVDESKKISAELNQKVDQLARLGKNMTAEQKEQMMEMQFELEEHAATDEELSGELERIQNVLVGGRSSSVIVRSQAYPGVIFEVYKRKYEVSEELPGPFRVRLDQHDHQILIEYNLSTTEI